MLLEFSVAARDRFPDLGAGETTQSASGQSENRKGPWTFRGRRRERTHQKRQRRQSSEQWEEKQEKMVIGMLGMESVLKIRRDQL